MAGQGQGQGQGQGGNGFNPVSSSGFSPAVPLSPATGPGTGPGTGTNVISASPVVPIVARAPLELPECAAVLGNIISQLTGLFIFHILLFL